MAILDETWEHAIMYLAHRGRLSPSQIVEIRELRPYFEALDRESEPGGALNRPASRVSPSDAVSEAHVRGYFLNHGPVSLRQAFAAEPGRPVDDVLAGHARVHPELYQARADVRVGPRGSLADALDSEPASVTVSVDRATRHLMTSGVVPRPSLQGILAERGVAGGAMARLVESHGFVDLVLSHALRHGLNVDYRVASIPIGSDLLEPFRQALYDVGRVTVYHLPREQAALYERAATIADTIAHLHGHHVPGRAWVTDHELAVAYPQSLDGLVLSRPDWIPASTYEGIRAAQDSNSLVSLVDTTDELDIARTVPLEPERAFQEMTGHLPVVERARLAERFGIRSREVGGASDPGSVSSPVYPSRPDRVAFEDVGPV